MTATAISPARQLRKQYYGLKAPLSCLSHLPGAVFGLVGTALLIAWSYHKPWNCISLSLFGISLVVCYGTSAFYHGMALPRPQSRKLQRVDHAGIFFLIAGTATPICTIVLPSRIGSMLMVMVWAAAIFGVNYSLRYQRVPRAYLAPACILVGCIAVLPYPILLERLGRDGFDLLAGGGILYLASGLVFHRKIKNYLVIAHLLQLPASAFHFVLYGWFVLPLNV